MHTRPSSSRDLAVSPFSSNLPAAPRWRRWAIGSAVAALMLSACGGGGGGGGSDPTDAGVQSGSSGATSPVPFPLGVALASPASLADASAVVSGSTGVVDLGLQTSATPLLNVLSSQADALATGRLGLSGSGLISVSALFDTSAASHAACYSPAVAYQNHDDAPGSSGTLPAGRVGMWQDSDTASSPAQPCSVAELNAQTRALSDRTNQALILMAGMRYLLASNSAFQMPTAGNTIDITPRASGLLSSLLGGITIQSASVSLNSMGSEFSYRLVLTRGSGASGQSLEINLLHTPAETDTRFAGVLQMTMGYLSTDASTGCSDQLDGSTGRYKVARLTTVGYNRQDQWLSLRVRSGQYCGNASLASSGHAGDLASLTMSGELNPAVFVNGSTRGATLGWRQGFVRMSADIVLSTLNSDFIYAWQDQPLGGTSHARMFAGHSVLDTGTKVRTMDIHHGYTDDITVSDGTLRGMVCNAAGGPGSTQTMQQLFQTQSMSLGGSASSWALTASHLRYAPTNSCNASGGMLFDVNGDGSLSSGEGSGVVHDLSAPGGGRIDVQDEIIERGFLPPILLL